MLMVTLLAALGWIFSKESLAHIEPLLFMGSRFLLAGGVIAIFARKEIQESTSRDITRVLVVSIFFSAGLYFWALGLLHGSHMGIGSFLTSMGVILAPCISPIFKDFPPKAVWFALPISLIGVGLLAIDSKFIFGIGELYYLMSAVAFAFYINLHGRAATKTPILTLTSIQLMLVGVILLPLSFLVEDWRITGGISILSWFFASVFIATSLRYFLQTYSLKLSSPSRVSLVLTFEPVWVAIIGSFWLEERMGILQIFGCLLILIAVLIPRIHAVAKLRNSSI